MGRIVWTLLLLATLFTAVSGLAQDRDGSTFTGIVISSTRNTLVVRDDTGQTRLFVYERSMRPVPIGAQVRVTSTPGSDPDHRIVQEVTVVKPPSSDQGATAAPAVPPEVRRVERDIRRQVRKYQAGFRVGVALDPELVLVGVHAQVGPFFHPDVYFRPSVEFAYGEVTALFGLNAEVIYRLPLSSRQGRWMAYFGAGPGFNFLHQNFERRVGQSRIDFGDFHSDTGLNILGGIRYRNGWFTELKTSIYADPAPTLRLILGYNF